MGRLGPVGLGLGFRVMLGLVFGLELELVVG